MHLAEAVKIEPNTTLHTHTQNNLCGHAHEEFQIDEYIIVEIHSSKFFVPSYGSIILWQFESSGLNYSDAMEEGKRVYLWTRINM